jgi:hypothetical protein
MSKTKEIVWFKNGNKKVVLLPTICNIKQVGAIELLGVCFNCRLFFSGHVDNVLSIVNQRFYLNQLQKQGLDLNGLNVVFNSLVLCRLTYACQAFSVFFFLSEFVLSRLQSCLNKACSRNYVQLGMTSEKFSNGQTVCSFKLYWTSITIHTSYYLILKAHMGVTCARVVISIPFR